MAATHPATATAALADHALGNSDIMRQVRSYQDGYSLADIEGLADAIRHFRDVFPPFVYDILRGSAHTRVDGASDQQTIEATYKELHNSISWIRVASTSPCIRDVPANFEAVSTLLWPMCMSTLAFVYHLINKPDPSGPEIHLCAFLLYLGIETGRTKVGQVALLFWFLLVQRTVQRRHTGHFEVVLAFIEEMHNDILEGYSKQFYLGVMERPLRKLRALLYMYDVHVPLATIVLRSLYRGTIEVTASILDSLCAKQKKQVRALLLGQKALIYDAMTRTTTAAHLQLLVEHFGDEFSK